MVTRTEIDYQISVLVQMLDEYVEYNDSVTFTDENQKEYVTSDTLVKNTERTNYTAIQELEEVKKDSLNEFIYPVIKDTTLLNLCFLLYNKVTDENIDKLIVSNDLLAYDRLDIDPNNPIIEKGTEIIYFK